MLPKCYRLCAAGHINVIAVFEELEEQQDSGYTQLPLPPAEARPRRRLKSPKLRSMIWVVLATSVCVGQGCQGVALPCWCCCSAAPC